MKRPAALCLAPLAMLIGCAPEASREPAVRSVWVRLPAVSGRPGAAYFTLTGGATPERLVAVESGRVATIELHESMSGMTTMRPLAQVDLPAGGMLTFAPGGRHAMLFGIDPRVKPGDAVPLAFRFADGRRLATSARTLAAGDPAPAE